MKTLPTVLTYLLRDRRARRNTALLLRFLAVLAVMIATYTVLFHVLMEWEGRQYSWVTGLYWTLVVMSTLGFGDITFTSDIGRLFSLVVLLSGIVFLLVLLPFTFIQFFYAPWIEAQAASRAPRSLPETTSGHVILTHYEPLAAALIARLSQKQTPYVLLVSDLNEALRLHDSGLNVVCGDLDRPETYARIRAERAALVATTAADAVNTNVAFTVREVARRVPIVATADSDAAVDVLTLAGADRVMQVSQMLGRALGRRVIGDAMSHVIGRFEELLVAEANAMRTPLVGKTLRENRLGALGVNVVGVWERGTFVPARPETMVTDHTMLVLAGSQEQLTNYDEQFAIYNVSGEPVVVIGCGRVGRATAETLRERGMAYRIVERDRARLPEGGAGVVGDAAELEILRAAGIMKAPTVVITTNDDNTNIYLTLYCRRLRPDIQIISRATLERNLTTLHRAGADIVMSGPSMGAGMIMNLLERGNTLMLAEGLDIFRVPVPASLAGRTLAESDLRAETGCNVVAIVRGGRTEISPPATAALPDDGEIVLIGTLDAEARFFKRYGERSTSGNNG
ncbi:MAG: NAD-binding protein [Phycisphaerales bacterium]|nr:NAD-binding protein [Phycisphaerales bacterium]